MATGPKNKERERKIPNCGEKCQECGSKNVTASNVQDKAFSIHYIDDTADFLCNDCGHTWNGQYGYKGLA